MFPQRAVPLALLVTVALAPVTLADAKSSSKARSTKGFVVACLKADGQTWVYRAKPRTCLQSDESTIERSLIPVKRISWTTWSAKKAKGTGKVTSSVDGAYSGKVTITASAPKRCSSKRTVFTKVVVAIPHMGTISIQRVSCPE